jgi:hypothetical protein
MTTTVTTSTVTTVTSLGFVVGLGLICTLSLIAFLLFKEIASAAGSERAVRWSRTLNIGIIPLLFAFAVIVAERVASV